MEGFCNYCGRDTHDPCGQSMQANKCTNFAALDDHHCDPSRRTVTPQQSGEIREMLHLIWCFADEMNERNWRDKQDYILQQANRLQTALGFIPSAHR